MLQGIVFRSLLLNHHAFYGSICKATLLWGVADAHMATTAEVCTFAA